MRSVKSRRLALAALAAVALIAGCKQNVQIRTIKTLLDDPGRFDKQTVDIVGDVSQAVGVMGYGAYRLNDGTGTIMVVTKADGAPRDGAHVGVEGEFRSAFTLGTETLAAIVESGRYTPPSK